MLRRPLIALAACLVAFGLPLAAKAQDAYFGPQVGVFMPASKALRDELGDNWWSVGASRIRVFKPNQSNIAHDWNAVGQSRNGSRVFILSGSLGYVMPFAKPGADTEPYAAIRGGLAYIDYAVDTTSGRKSDKVVGFNGNAALGVTFSGRFNLEVRYDVWNSYDGLTFNGLTLAARFGIARF